MRPRTRHGRRRWARNRPIAPGDILVAVLRGIRSTLIAACCWGLSGCVSSTFNCSDDTSCQGLAGGQCETNGFCSGEDDTCESGRRYGSLAPASIADRCVAATTETTGPVPAGGSSSSSESTGLTTSLGTGSTGSTSVATTTDGTTGGVGTTDEEGSSTGVPPSPPLFDDDFERPNAEEVGNGWSEKTPEAFSIVDGVLTRVAGDAPYTENLVYRTDLTAADVELEAEFHYLDAASDTAPQLYARLDVEASLGTGNTRGYYLFVFNASQLFLGRSVSLDNVSDFDSSTPVPPLSNGVDYRMRLRVTGSGPVELEGVLERMEGGQWLESARVQGQDASSDAFGAGSAAVSAGPDLDTFAYDRVSGRPVE